MSANNKLRENKNESPQYQNGLVRNQKNEQNNRNDKKSCKLHSAALSLALLISSHKVIQRYIKADSEVSMQVQIRRLFSLFSRMVKVISTFESIDLIKEVSKVYPSRSETDFSKRDRRFEMHNFFDTSIYTLLNLT